MKKEIAKNKLKNENFDLQRNLQSISATSYASITHRHSEEIGKTTPSHIGICLTPFPNNVDPPEASKMYFDHVPRCPACSAFYNKFNTISGGKYRCSLCGQLAEYKLALDYNGIECNNEVYDAYIESKYSQRERFIPTEYFIISLSLLNSHKNLLDCIKEYILSSYQPKQSGIAILHGAITLVKFRPSLILQTFPDGPPIARSPLFYVAAPSFANLLKEVNAKAESLRYVEQPDFAKNVVEFAFSMSYSYGTNVHFILDDIDLQKFSAFPDLKYNAMKMTRCCVQTNLTIFSNNTYYQNPLFDYCTITGGFLKIFSPNVDDDTLRNELCNILLYPTFHDTFLFVCPPDTVNIVEYAGHGMMKSFTGINVPKIKVGDKFFLKFDSSSCSNLFIQFVVYFTTYTGIKKARVVTLPLVNCPLFDPILVSSLSFAFVCHRALVEGKESAKKALDDFKKKFKKVYFDKSEIVLNESNYLRILLYALGSFNDTLYLDEENKNIGYNNNVSSLNCNNNIPTTPNQYDYHV